jgi:hypothetical protein
MRDHRVQLERPMRLAAVQIDRHRGDGDVREAERDKRAAPPRKIEKA